jgi:hypothetical protein
MGGERTRPEGAQSLFLALTQAAIDISAYLPKRLCFFQALANLPLLYDLPPGDTTGAIICSATRRFLSVVPTETSMSAVATSNAFMPQCGNWLHKGSGHWLKCRSHRAHWCLTGGHIAWGQL